MINSEVERFAPDNPSPDIAAYGDEIGARVLLGGETPPTFLKADPAALADHLLTTSPAPGSKVPLLAEQLSAVCGIPLKQAVRAVSGFAAEIRKFRVVGDTRMGLFKAVRPALTEVLPRGVRAVAPGAESSLGWYLAAITRTRDVSGLFGKILNAHKGNLTALSLSTQKTNAVANAVAIGVETGKDPLTVLFEAGAQGFGWLRWRRTGKAPSPMHETIYRKLGKYGILDTSLMDAELASLVSPPGALPGRGIINAMKRVAGGVQRVGGATYKFGDQVFKISRAILEYKNNKADVDLLDYGDSLVATLPDGAKVRITKTTHLDPDPKLEAIKGITPQKVARMDLDDVLVQWSAKPAVDVLFDYGKVGAVVKAIQASKTGGLVSPFMIWPHKAFDLPGKPGLLTHILVGAMPGHTTSKAVARARARRAIAVGVRRNMLVQGAQSAFLEANDEELRQVFNWNSTQANMTLLAAHLDPGYIRYQRWHSGDFAQSSMRAIRLGTLIGAIYQDAVNQHGPGKAGKALLADMEADLEGMSPEEAGATRKRITKTTELLAALHSKRKKKKYGDAVALGLDLIGVTGSPLVKSLVDYIDTAEKGEEHPSRLSYSILGMMFGRTTASAVKVLSEASTPGSTRYITADPKEYESQARAGVRELLGLGWRVALLSGEKAVVTSGSIKKFKGAVERFLTKGEGSLQKSVRTEWQGQIRAARGKAEEIRELGDEAQADVYDLRADALEDRQKMLNQIITEEWEFARTRIEPAIRRYENLAEKQAPKRIPMRRIPVKEPEQASRKTPGGMDIDDAALRRRALEHLRKGTVPGMKSTGKVQ